MTEAYEARIAELEAEAKAQRQRANGWRAEYDALSDRAAKLKKELDESDADWQAILDNERRTMAIARERIEELEMRLNGERIAATDNGTLPEDPRLNMWRDDAIAILELHGWQTPQRLSNGEIEHIMHTDARNFDEYRAAIYGAPVKYRWLDDWCMWVDVVGDPVLAKDWQQWRLDNAELVEASE